MGVRLLKQSTAKTLRLGPFLDSTDGVTAETALTIAQADIQISKDGGAFAQTSDSSPTTTHDTDGWYQLPLTSTDTDTLGPLTVQVVESGALPVWEHFMVVPANVYDSLVGGSDNLEVDVTAISGDSTAANNLESDYDGTGYTKTNSTIGTVTDVTNAVAVDSVATDAVDAAALAASAVSEIQTGLATASALNTVDSVVDAIRAVTDDLASANNVADALLDRANAVDGYTPREAMRLMGSALAGVLAGAGTTTITIDALDGSKTRITATVDGDGNRSALTLDAT